MFSLARRKIYNNLIPFWFFVSVKNYEVNLSRRLKTAAHEIGLEICYNFFFYFKKILLYSLNIYKTIPQNSITSFLSFPSKKITENPVLEHCNSRHLLNVITMKFLIKLIKVLDHFSFIFCSLFAFERLIKNRNTIGSAGGYAIRNECES